MNVDLLIVVAVAVLLLTCGALILMGRGDWLISGYNTANEEKRAKYNVSRLRLLTGVTSLFVGGVLVVAYYVESESLITYTVVPLVVVVVVLSNTWAKRK